MDLFLFDKQKYRSLYNCSFYDVDQIPWEQRSHSYWGTLFLVGYAVAMILYVPCVWAMCSSDLRHGVTYKLMIQLGVTQIIGLQFAGLYNGVQSVLGIVFCSAPDWMYVSSTFICSHWPITTVTCNVLGINRLCELYSPKFAEKLFDGKKVYIWMSIPLIYGYFMLMYMTPLIYNSSIMNFHVNPHLGYLEDDSESYFASWIVYHDVVICTTEFLITVLMPILYYRSTRLITSNGSTAGSKYEKQIFFQVVLIGMANFLTSLIYEVFQWLPSSFVLSLTGIIVWFSSQSVTAVVYLSINRNIRSFVFKKLGIFQNQVNSLSYREQAFKTPTKSFPSISKQVQQNEVDYQF